MGGMCFSLNMLWAQVFPYVALEIYLSRDATSSLQVIPPDELRNVLVALSLVWVASAVSFALVIKRRYLRTFVSTSTASQYTIQLFRESKADENRFDAVFGVHRFYYEPILAEVKSWLAERYPIWQLERPVWFNEAAISSIPDDLLPKEALRDLVTQGGGKRRRLSLGDRLSYHEKRPGADIVLQ